MLAGIRGRWQGLICWAALVHCSGSMPGHHTAHALQPQLLCGATLRRAKTGRRAHLTSVLLSPCDGRVDCSCCGGTHDWHQACSHAQLAVGLLAWRWNDTRCSQWSSWPMTPGVGWPSLPLGLRCCLPRVCFLSSALQPLTASLVAYHSVRRCVLLLLCLLVCCDLMYGLGAAHDSAVGAACFWPSRLGPVCANVMLLLAVGAVFLRLVMAAAGFCFSVPWWCDAYPLFESGSPLFESGWQAIGQFPLRFSCVISTPCVKHTSRGQMVDICVLTKMRHLCTYQDEIVKQQAAE
jgi:hypothetical protein